MDGGGGIIAPSLFLGAVLGGLLGCLVKLAGFQVRPDLYLAGMGTVLTVVAHAPLVSILILREWTHDYKLTLPSMLAVVLQVSVPKLIFSDSLYNPKGESL